MSDTSRDRSSRPPTGAAGRGVVLVVFALIVGLVLLWKGPVNDRRVLTDPSTASTIKDDVAVTVTPQTTASTVPVPVTQVPPAQLTIAVANGSGKGGVAGSLVKALSPAGYTQAKSTNATSTVAASVIYFDAGYEADAKAVATAAKLSPVIVKARPASVPLAAADQTAKVLVILGQDYSPG